MEEYWLNTKHKTYTKGSGSRNPGAICVVERSAYEKAIKALEMIRNEFRMAPKPSHHFMADQAVKALDELGIS